MRIIEQKDYYQRSRIEIENVKRSIRAFLARNAQDTNDGSASNQVGNKEAKDRSIYRRKTPRYMLNLPQYVAFKLVQKSAVRVAKYYQLDVLITCDHEIGEITFVGTEIAHDKQFNSKRYVNDVLRLIRWAANIWIGGGICDAEQQLQIHLVYEIRRPLFANDVAAFEKQEV